MAWTDRTSPIQVGDTVAYSRRFLKSTGQLTGNAPFARGTVTALVPPGSIVLAEIALDGDAYLIPSLPVVASIPTAAGLSGIFLVFLKIGCIVFGSGYVLLAFLRADLVVHRHWLTEGQLLDSVAVGQVTPAPFLLQPRSSGTSWVAPRELSSRQPGFLHLPSSSLQSLVRLCESCVHRRSWEGSWTA